MFHTIKYDMTKKQVRKLSLEYSNMAPYQKFSLNVKRKPKTVLLLALKEFKPCLLVHMPRTSPRNRAPRLHGAGKES